MSISRKIRKHLFTSKKVRIGYSVAMIITIVLGLTSRIYTYKLPDIISEHAGDSLWAIMIYIGIRIIWVYRSLLFAAILSLLFCYLMECSQLYQAIWINDIRHTMLGGLVLGKGFLWIDLVRYTFGILLAVGLDDMILKLRRVR